MQFAHDNGVLVPATWAGNCRGVKPYSSIFGEKVE